MNTLAEPPTADLLADTVRRAFEAGATVAVLVRGHADHRFVGQVQNVTADSFAIYHSGVDAGWRWSFRFADAVAVGLLTPGPTEASLAPCFTHHA